MNKFVEQSAGTPGYQQDYKRTRFCQILYTNNQYKSEQTKTKQNTTWGNISINLKKNLLEN